MINKLRIPSEGTNFCGHCFQFEKHSVDVNETGDYVTVTLTCECGNKVIHSDPKDTFFEYDKDSITVTSNLI
jgi:hypothetical protein